MLDSCLNYTNDQNISLCIYEKIFNFFLIFRYIYVFIYVVCDVVSVVLFFVKGIDKDYVFLLSKKKKLSLLTGVFLPTE